MYLLALEGVNQLALYSVAQQQVSDLTQLFGDATLSNSTVSFVNSLNGTITDLSNAFAAAPPVPQIINTSFTEILNGTITEEEALNLIRATQLFLLQTYGYEIESFDSEGYAGFVHVITTAYLYFFIAAGVALLILAALLCLSRKNTARAEWGFIGVRCAVGTGLCLSTLMLKQSNDDPGQDDNWGSFVNSGWLLPTVVLCYALGMPPTVSP